jgi:hypothetical protein
VHTVVLVAPAAPLDEELAFVPADPQPETSATVERSCDRELRFNVGRVSLSNASVRRMFEDARKPLRDAMCDCAKTSSALVAITPAKGAIEISNVDDATAECIRARLVPPSFVPWTFQPDCPTCGGPTPAPDGTLFAHVRFF